MSLSALPIALAVPPINVLGLCAAGLVLARWYRGFGLALLSFGVLALFVLATPFASGWLICSLERTLPLIPPVGDAPQAIVILSGNLAHDARSAVLAPGWLTLERERAGAALARRTGLPILVTGGRVENSAETLGAVMARSMAEDFRTPVRWVEGDAEDTWANAENSAAMLKAQHISSIYLVTHAWHMRRALIAFAHTGLAVTAAPIRIDPAPEAVASDFIPSASAWQVSYYALHEWLGCLYYAVFRG
jgi:uncharacterized SAM-binding protein YcdF (DUF218 family)